MKEKTKSNRSLHIYDEIFFHSKTNSRIRSIAEWVNTAYPEAFMNKDRLKNEIEELERLIAVKKAEFDAINTSDDVSIPPHAANWLKNEAVRRVYDRGIPVEGVLKVFNNQFGQQLNKRQFELLLHQAKGGVDSV